MNDTFTIAVTSVHDIMSARARVRELARQKGLGITDQARISLASSSLADVLGLGTHREGQIVIDSMEEENRTGIRVVCTTAKGAKRELTSAQLDVHQLLVDELTIEMLPSDDVQVTMIQWSTPRRKV